MKLIFFMRESFAIIFLSLKQIAKITLGNPPPQPTSRIFLWFLKLSHLLIAKESKTCFSKRTFISFWLIKFV